MKKNLNLGKKFNRVLIFNINLGKNLNLKSSACISKNLSVLGTSVTFGADSTGSSQPTFTDGTISDNGRPNITFACTNYGLTVWNNLEDIWITIFKKSVVLIGVIIMLAGWLLF